MFLEKNDPKYKKKLSIGFPFFAALYITLDTLCSKAKKTSIEQKWPKVMHRAAKIENRSAIINPPKNHFAQKTAIFTWKSELLPGDFSALDP